ncbi:MAG: Eco57I restriction-modification methylase domain-containing protein, partial [Ottowia sp.]|nr:Eco57I restriction-modification methylase domain-containing protein [Ottowia sp.]
MQGQLFSQDFLLRGVRETPAWQALTDEAVASFRARLHAVFSGRDADSALNEAQTEAELISPVLGALGWDDSALPQVNLSAKRREDVPDWLLFANRQSKQQALALPKDEQRLRHGIALLEAKRWLRALDRGDPAEPQDPDAPSSQMLRYLSRADVVSDRRVKWGVLTNGAVWRLYWQDARSRAEEFFELNLAVALGVPGAQGDFDDPAPDHALRLFLLFFGRAAFLPQDWDAAGRTLHAYAQTEARLYQEQVAQNLGQRVFDNVFAQLADALAKADLHAQTHTIGYGQFTRPQFTPAYLDEVREAALVLLYRLLFLFYAEDRNLLPVRDERYAEYSVRRIREDVRDRVDSGATFSSTMPKIWLALQGVFQLIDKGDDDIGMPAYNGGLFHRSRSPLLERTHVPDKVMAPIIDALSRRTEEVTRGWINYRDLSVSHLGGIYERLLEYALVHEVQAKDDYKDKPEINRLVAQPASFARKVSGSYYTHDDLVRLVLRESVGLLAREKQAAFEQRLAGWKKRATLSNPQWQALDGDPDAGMASIDPASQLLELKICDPAMGSGHFLVTLVDFLADRVLEAMTSASESVNAQPWAAHLAEAGRPWQSPVLGRIAQIRRAIKQNAATHGWAVTDAQLDDRHIVRRMILKKTIFGVDKNPMAVELAKTALWLHTFTVGAPLSFLDHHLQTGDSLQGERFDAVERGLHALGTLFQQGEMQRLKAAADAIAQVADLTDADIGEVQRSQALAEEAERQLAPIHAVLDFWRALRWLIPGWPVAKNSQLTKLLKDQPERQAALARLLDPQLNLVATLSKGELLAQDGPAQAANFLMKQARELAARETFFHWWTRFPTVFGPGGRGGFDIVLGNPPWDRIKLQQVEWFAERDLSIAAQPRAADRKALITALQQKNAPLWQAYAQAAATAETQARVVGTGKLGSGDYPLLGGGDVNLYSLFVERAQTLAAPDGLVALVTPSGIAADKGAAPFFRALSETGRLGAMLDFENRKGLFPDVDSRFKFCVLLFGGPERAFAQTRCAFFLHSLDELDTEPERTLLLTAADFARVNPNTGAAPIFRSRRDADITLGIYARHPVLVRHGPQGEDKAWPVKYARMFDMTNDSGRFLKPDELER